MKQLRSILLPAIMLLWTGISCNNATQESAATEVKPADAAAQPLTGQSGVQDDVSQKDVVKIAVGSPDHTTLVTALKAAEYVDVLSNAGPFTVFAPTNAAFEKLPAGTVEGLLKPEKKNDLRNILEYHVYVGVLKPEFLQDGQSFGQVNGQNIKIGVKDGKITVNGANVIASIPATNGIIHVLDGVLLPPAK
ncbi:MAG: fasciclin domain-containing protein [Chitinophagaceae bacterium]